MPYNAMHSHAITVQLEREMDWVLSHPDSKEIAQNERQHVFLRQREIKRRRRRRRQQELQSAKVFDE